MKYLKFIIPIVLCLFSFPAFAQVNDKELEYKPAFMDHLSKLYWALGSLSINNTNHLNNYLRINECKYFRNHFTNEFEWKEILSATQKHLELKKSGFPTKIRFVKPIYLGEYNVENESFDILENSQVEGVRKFQVDSIDAKEEICGTKAELEGYPRRVLVELSRPFSIETLKITPEIALDYIEEKEEEFKKQRKFQKKFKQLYEKREVYLALNIKFHAYKDVKESVKGEKIANLLGVLEGYEIYTDEKLELLMYRKQFTNIVNQDSVQTNLPEQYAARYERIKDFIGDNNSNSSIQVE